MRPRVLCDTRGRVWVLLPTKVRLFLQNNGSLRLFYSRLGIDFRILPRWKQTWPAVRLKCFPIQSCFFPASSHFFTKPFERIIARLSSLGWVKNKMRSLYFSVSSFRFLSICHSVNSGCNCWTISLRLNPCSCKARMLLYSSSCADFTVSRGFGTFRGVCSSIGFILSCTWSPSKLRAML